MNRSLRQAGVLVAGVASLLVFAATAVSAGHGSITAVRVTGGPSRPVFTVTGRGLSVPKPSPATSPSGQPLCPLQISGNAGFDYGNSFFVIIWDAQPADANTQLYAAGRYRPKLNELDCVGIVVLSHTSRRITFTFGHGYQQYYATKPRFVHNGDVVEVGLRGATYATVVHF